MPNHRSPAANDYASTIADAAVRKGRLRTIVEAVKYLSSPSRGNPYLAEAAAEVARDIPALWKTAEEPAMVRAFVADALRLAGRMEMNE